MKKIKILGLLVLVMLVSACTTKKVAIDEDKFISIMKNEGFTIVDVEEQFEQFDGFEEAYVAINPTGKYQIEFYELENDSYTINFYNNNKSRFESSKKGATTYTSVDLNNYNKYTLTTSNKYKVLSRIGETMIYLDVDKEYKNEVNSILEKLGY